MKKKVVRRGLLAKAKPPIKPLANEAHTGQAMTKFGHQPPGVNVPMSRRKVETARREGLRLYEDGSLGEDRRQPRLARPVRTAKKRQPS